jgi:hypothetical protein
MEAGAGGVQCTSRNAAAGEVAGDEERGQGEAGGRQARAGSLNTQRDRVRKERERRPRKEKVIELDAFP